MEIGDWRATSDLNDLYREIRERGLETNVAELDAFGFTVVENAISTELTGRLRELLASEAERRKGRPFDFETEADLEGVTLLSYHRDNPRLATLLGAGTAYGWTDEGPDMKRLGRAVSAGRSWPA